MKPSKLKAKALLLLPASLFLQLNCPCLAAPSVDNDSLSIRIDRLSHDETPLLDLAMDQELISQNKSDPIPILRDGISLGPVELENEIDNLTGRILLKQIELERYSIRYNMEVAKQGRWKGWRYGFFQEANSGLGLGGGIASVVNRGGHIHEPSKVRLHLQEGANIVPMIGGIIGASAAGLEFGINEWHELETHKKGFSPKQARKRVKTLKDEINQLLAERAALVRKEVSEPRLKGRLAIDRAEEVVLKDMLDQKLEQFERFHVAKRRLLAFQQMQYLFDIAKNVTNAIGCDFAYQSLHRHKRIYNGRAGVLFVVSGGLTMIGPVASRLFGKVVADSHRRFLRPTTEVAEDATLEKLKADHALLDRLARDKATTPEKAEVLVHRSTIYAAGEKRFEDDIRAAERAQDKAKLTATQNIGAGAYVGGSKVASGILFILPGFDSRYNGKGFRADRATNNDLFASAVIGLPASVFSIYDTLRINIRGEIARQKQLKQGIHPGQLAKARLAELDELERSIKARLN